MRLKYKIQLKLYKFKRGLSNVIDLVSNLPEQNIKIALNTYGKMFYDELRKTIDTFNRVFPTENQTLDLNQTQFILFGML